MNQKIRDMLAKLYQEPGLSPEEALNLLKEVSIQMMRYRDQLLERGQRGKARDIHRTLARYYRHAATLVPSKRKELFLILSDYWRRGGESFWEPSTFGPKKISPSKTDEEDQEISTTEYEERERLDLGEEQAEATERGEEISIELEEEQAEATERGEEISIELEIRRGRDWLCAV